ncbi:glycoside hydrolase family 3 protein [Tabrizicola piscis]|uniref:beta-N-acetylhexosaminidase n=1 Tax=Tabrizicola piscis TaxID=2494374 RepID=A0A3S8UBC1_9RHOB|nr:glycoside hydrolase family 3 N-terminal domain-containing protein [Tabrizicola piscis]AZL60923.1 glycoside hydrolase family 3 protein [Tabrizicola piscis]
MTAAFGATILGCAGPALLPEERAFFRAADPFGFILFARNVETPDQLRRLTGDLRDAVGRDAPILVDQEGGRVQRLRAPHWHDWDPPLETVERAGSLAEAARILRLRSQVIAAELAAVGIDANCAPVADVAFAQTHPFLRNRCYGTDPASVATIGRAVADGLLAGGVLPVLKHMPGHGRSHLDTHLSLPTVTAGLDDLRAVDFAPFRALADLPMAMTAHLVFAALDPDLPATQSPTMIRQIRDEIGFQGLLMTDDLNMEALSGSLADRTARSMAAGVDVALHCKGDLAEMAAVVDAAGQMTPAAMARGRAALALRRKVAADMPALLAELADG